MEHQVNISDDLKRLAMRWSPIEQKLKKSGKLEIVQAAKWIFLNVGRMKFNTAMMERDGANTEQWRRLYQAESEMLRRQKRNFCEQFKLTPVEADAKLDEIRVWLERMELGVRS